jgi:hypothetical protein
MWPKSLLVCWLLLGLPLAAAAQTTSNVLTSAQCSTLKADIAADGALNTARTTRQDQVIADAYTTAATPTYWVWKSSLSRTDLLYSTSQDGTTYDTAGAGFVTRTVQELMLFESLFDKTTQVTNPMNALIRTSFGVAISGATAPAPANRTHMLAMARRAASRMEKLFATGTGSTAAPALMTFEGTVTVTHVACALNLP